LDLHVNANTYADFTKLFTTPVAHQKRLILAR